MLINCLEISKIRSFKSCFVSLIISLFLSLLIAIAHKSGYGIIPLVLYPLMFITAYKITFGKIKISQIYLSLVIEFISVLISTCLTMPIFQLSSLSYNDSDIISLFCIRLILLFMTVILDSIPRNKKIYLALQTIPKHIFILILFAFICITVLSSCNNLPVESSIKTIIITILIAVLTITLVIMIFSLLINVASKNYYTALNSLLEKQVEAQITHYEKLEELNRDIRQLRHDYINHLTSVSTLIEHKNYSDALQYIERLTESTHCNETIFSTGNHLADAILTGKSNECKEFADIEFNGIITDRINNMDMCAILANALDNAIEACRKCSGRSKISIAAQNKQGYWVMTMRNPTIGEDSEGLMKTSKEDTQNHGFGLLSIEQAVKRYDGNIKVGIKDGIFEISIVVKD